MKNTLRGLVLLGCAALGAASTASWSSRVPGTPTTADVRHGMGWPLQALWGSDDVGSEADVAVVEPPPAPVVEPVPVRPSDPYEGKRFDLELLRTSLAEQQARGVDVRSAARAVLGRYLPSLMEDWLGTAYSFTGTTEVPRQGTVACGYFVSTVLQHAGFQVERVDLARQPAEQILRTMVPDPDILRLHRSSRRQVVDAVQEHGPGIYIVGLDTHVGFLVNHGRQVEFCHSTSRRNRGVVCEEAVSSPSLRSRYIVVGQIDNDIMVDTWLAQGPLPTARKGQVQAFWTSEASPTAVATTGEEPTPSTSERATTPGNPAPGRTVLMP